MSRKHGFAKFLAGAAIGVGIGLLFAPRPGKETREILKKKLDDVIEEAKKIKMEDVKNEILKKVEEIKEELQDLDKEKALKLAKEKAKKIQKKAEDLYKLAKEKGTPVLQKTTAELKQTTAEALKKIVTKLEA